MPVVTSIFVDIEAITTDPVMNTTVDIPAPAFQGRADKRPYQVRVKFYLIENPFNRFSVSSAYLSRRFVPVYVTNCVVPLASEK